MPWGIGHGGPKKFLYDKPVKALTRLMELPCMTPPGVFAEASAASLIDAFLMYASPDPREIYTKMFGQSIFCHIESTAGSVFHLPSSPRSPYQRWLLPFARMADVSTYYYFLAGVAANGVIEFATLARKLTHCDDYNSQHSATGLTWVSAISDDGHYQGCDFDTGHAPPLGPFMPSNLVVDHNYTAYLAPSVTWESATGVTVPTAGHILWYPDGVDPSDPDAPHVATLDANANHVDSYGNAHPTIMFTKIKNKTGQLMILNAQWAYTGGVPLPYHEAFPSAGNTCFFGLYPHR